jgi:diadenosine tetraphosphate (Ap4A) HIT family hydrolase
VTPTTVRGCRFCALRTHENAVIYGSVYVIADAYPVAPGHHLIIPIRHCDDVFQLTPQEMVDTQTALVALHNELAAGGWDAFNVGWNAGAAAGQTVGHAHCHLIPRKVGDVADPVGGIRGVIPARRNYLSAAG